MEDGAHPICGRFGKLRGALGIWGCNWGSSASAGSVDTARHRTGSHRNSLLLCFINGYTSVHCTGVHHAPAIAPCMFKIYFDKKNVATLQIWCSGCIGSSPRGEAE